MRSLMSRVGATVTPAAATRTILAAILGHLEPRAPLLDAFVDRVPAERYAAAISTLRARVSDTVFHLLAAQRPGLEHGELERRSWMLVTLTQHITVRYLLDRPPIDREEFLDDLAGLVLRAGLGDRAQTGSPPQRADL